MRRLALVILGGLATATAFGQNLLECVNPDVLSGLVFRGNSDADVAVSAEMPSEMAGISIPGSFQWIASINRNDRLTAAFKTDLSMDDATSAAIEDLGDGWAVRQQMSFGSGAFGANAMPVSRTACRANATVSVMANDFEGTTFVTYTFGDDPLGTSCDQGNARSPFGTASPFEAFMPEFEFPPDPVTGVPYTPRGSSGGGGGQAQERATEIELNDSIGNLTRFLSDQLPAQGWQADSNWTGRLTAGSSWTRQPSAEATFQGTLEITALSDSRYEVLFRVARLN